LIYTGCSKDDEVTTYTVTFDADGGSPVPSDQNVEAGKTATAPATNPAKSGYIFLFWRLSGASTAYNFSTPVNGNITLQAKWEEESKVEYWQVSWELNGGAWPASGDNHATQVVKGGTLSEPAAPVKSGNTFDGWYKETALNTKINFPYDVSSVTANFTLYAKWTTEGNSTDPAGYKMFTSLADLKSWLASQPANTVETVYKVGLKNVNLDNGTNWADLGTTIKGSKYADLNLQNCTATAIPDGYQETTRIDINTWITKTYSAFVECNSLVAVALPKSLKTIGKWTFYECRNLHSVILPDGLTEIHNDAFHGCRNLISVSLPEEIKILGQSSFQNSGLTSITIPGSVSEIGSSAFNVCYSLTSVVINEGVENIGSSAFWDCTSLRSVTLPQSLKIIDSQSFRNCHSITSLSLPSGLASIGAHAFLDCTGLTSIIIPDKITIINEGTFSGCNALTSITLPANLISIAYSSFWCKNLLSIEIPAKVNYIGDLAFSQSGVQTFIMRPTIPPTLGATPLSTNNYSSIVIKVPATSVNAYKTGPGYWGSLYYFKVVANTY
jgi:uncharacterized repeat protein (TIGR02543 family)